MDIALGQPADRPLSTWEEMFIPMRMRDALRKIQVPGIATSMSPLVAEERTIYRSSAHHERQDAPRRWPLNALVGLLLAAQLIVVARLGERKASMDTLFRLETIVWSSIVGILGVILLLAWTTTQHIFWFRNENLMLINPLALWLAVLTGMSMRNARWLRAAAICAVIVALLSAVALLVNGLPWFPQDNLAVILLFLPPHFAVAYGLWRRAVPSIPPTAEHEAASMTITATRPRTTA
jgi:hypothetical protein